MTERKRIYALDVIATSLAFLQEDGRYLTLRQFLPYCIYKFGTNWLPLNRDYKPLGILNEDWVKYEDYDYLFIPEDYIDASSEKLEKDLLHPSTPAVWLFTDSTVPFDKKNKIKYLDKADKLFFGKYIR